MNLKNRLMKLEIVKTNKNKIYTTIVVMWETEEYGKIDDILYTPEQIESKYPESKYQIINIRLDN
jgi:hypothetical protein